MNEWAITLVVNQLLLQSRCIRTPSNPYLFNDLECGWITTGVVSIALPFLPIPLLPAYQRRRKRAPQRYYPALVMIQNRRANTYLSPTVPETLV